MLELSPLDQINLDDIFLHIMIGHILYNQSNVDDICIHTMIGFFYITHLIESTLMSIA